jgi:hypothetical protein
MAMKTFRIHFSDGATMDVTAANANAARMRALVRKQFELGNGRTLLPGVAAKLLPRIEKTKLLREA